MIGTSTQAVLFDLDGTLVDTTELILQTHEHMLDRHIRTAWRPTRRDLILVQGRSLPQTLLEFAQADQAANAAEAAEQMLQTFRDYQDANHDRLIRPFQGMRETLETLSKRGYMLGVVTSKREETARLALDRYDLSRFLPLGVFFDDTTRHKPDPEPLLLAMRKGNLQPARTAYVGDSIHDVAAGKAAGILTVAALWGPFDPRDLQLAEPDEMADSPAALLDLFPDPSGEAGPAS